MNDPLVSENPSEVEYADQDSQDEEEQEINMTIRQDEANKYLMEQKRKEEQHQMVQLAQNLRKLCKPILVELQMQNKDKQQNQKPSVQHHSSLRVVEWVQQRVDAGKAGLQTREVRAIEADQDNDGMISLYTRAKYKKASDYQAPAAATIQQNDQQFEEAKSNQESFQPPQYNIAIEDEFDSQEVISERQSQSDKNSEQNIKSEKSGQSNINQTKSSLKVSKKDASWRPRIMICITIYNEELELFDRTIQGIYDEVSELKSLGIGSHDILVVIVYDGILNLTSDSAGGKSQQLLRKFEYYDLLFRQDEFFESWKEEFQAKCDPKLESDPQFQKIFKKLEARSPQTAQRIDLQIQTAKILQRKRSMPHQLEKYRTMQKWASLDKFKFLREPYTLSAMMQKMLNKQMRLTQENRANESEAQIKSWAIDELQKRAKQYIEDRDNVALLYQVFENDEIAGMEDSQTYEEKIQLNQFQSRNDNGDKKNSKNKKLKENNTAEDDMLDNRLHMIHCVKFANKKKLNSHLWFFEGFCRLIDPQYCFIMDAGVQPESKSLKLMFQAFEADSNVGGLCGFMSCRSDRIYDDFGDRLDDIKEEDIGSISLALQTYVFSVSRAQIFEYNIAHIIDKSIESALGFIHVLPGAFSAYRWDALSGKNQEKSILENYLKQQLQKDFNPTLEELNMYLAEDRIMCLELFCLKNRSFRLKYLPNANATVDPVKNVAALTGQRRRWLNGTWFALNFVLSNQCKVLRSSHDPFQILAFEFNLLYSFIMKIVTYFMISLFLVVQVIIINSSMERLIDSDSRLYKFLSPGGMKPGVFVTQVFLFVYLILILVTFYTSLNYANNKKIAKQRIFSISTALGVYFLIVFGFTLYGSYNLYWGYQPDEQVDLNDAKQQLYSFKSLQLMPDAKKLLQIQLAITIFGHVIPILLQCFGEISFQSCREPKSRGLRFPIKFLGFKKSADMLISLPSYLFYSPTYIHIFLINAFARIDDLSWGTKGQTQNEKGSGDKQKQDNYEQSAKWKKVTHLMLWLSLNFIFSYASLAVVYDPRFQIGFIMALGWFASGLTALRAVFSSLYILWYFVVNRITYAVKFRRGGKQNKMYKSQNTRKLQHLKENYEKMGVKIIESRAFEIYRRITIRRIMGEKISPVRKLKNSQQANGKRTKVQPDLQNRSAVELSRPYRSFV